MPGLAVLIWDSVRVRTLNKKEPPRGRLESDNREASNRVDRSHSRPAEPDVFFILAKA
jgi:hypothetical protein